MGKDFRENYKRVANRILPKHTPSAFDPKDVVRVEDLTILVSGVIPAIVSGIIGTGSLGGGSVGPHNLLSSTHTDTIAASGQTGDIIISSSSGWQRLPIGSTGRVLTVVNGLPGWAIGSGSNTITVSSGTTTTVNVPSTSFFVALTSGVTSVNMPGTPNLGETHIIKDIDGVAGSISILISGNGNTIDGAVSTSLNNNYESVTLIKGPREWNII